MEPVEFVYVRLTPPFYYNPIRPSVRWSIFNSQLAETFRPLSLLVSAVIVGRIRESIISVRLATDPIILKMDILPDPLGDRVVHEVIPPPHHPLSHNLMFTASSKPNWRVIKDHLAIEGRISKSDLLLIVE
jgi:hypothetical protein